MAVSATVLVADDQASPRNRVANVLRQHGFRVLMAADGLQALSNCHRERPDVVVLDMVMPHMDGIAVCRALRGDAILPYIPILFCSNHDATADRVHALRAGGDDFVGKDIDDEELVARVEALVRIKELLDTGARAQEARVATTVDSEGEVQIADHEYLEHRLDLEFDRALEHNEPLSLLIIATEEAARADDQGAIPRRVAACGRGNEVVTRYRDVGFALVLPNTHFGGAMASAERVWRALPPGSKLADSHNEFTGVSIGAACYPNPEINSASDLLEFTNAALDRARAEGPAHVCLYHHQAYIFRPDE